MFAIVTYILILLLAFYFLALVTDEFFVPALEIISKKLRLSSDAAGATLMAIGSSAPELFTSLYAVLRPGNGTENVGGGTIVGSALFNVLVIAGASAIIRPARLNWQPLLRDSGFYLLAIMALLIAFWDGKVVFYEAATFLLMYLTYVILVVNWGKILNYVEDLTDEDIVDENENVDLVQRTISMRLKEVLSVVIPNPKSRPNFYMAAFILSIFSIAGLSFVLVEVAVHLADRLSINPTIVALTILAAGTSLPDLLSSLIVAKKGRSDMAVSNAVGSNIFDILFGLGFPWMVLFLLKDGQIHVDKDSLVSSTVILLFSVIFFVGLVVARKWRVDRFSGVIFLSIYILYLVYIVFTTV